MLKDLWNIAVKIFITAGVILSVIFLAELARIFLLFYRIHPVFGLGFAGLLAMLVLILLWHLLAARRRNPPVLVAPPLPDLDEATHAEMKAYCLYLGGYLDRLASNANLDEPSRSAAREQVLYIKDVLGAHPLNDDLRMTIRKTEGDVIAPLLEKLGEQSSREVRRCVRDVMIGVTLSPYPSMDLVIVIYRNLAMATRVISIYRSRPAIREQLMILRDIFLVVATVNFLNLNRKLLENLFSQVPIVGRFIDDIGQGVGAGILTSVAGHAAMDRCAAFRGWDRADEVASLGARSTQFLVDVRLMFTRDLLPELKNRIRADVPAEKAEEPGFWDAIERGINSAVDLTAKGWDSFVVKPAVAGVQGVGAIARGVVRGGSTVVRASARGSRTAAHGAGRLVRTVFDRVKYTLLGRRMNRM